MQLVLLQLVGYFQNPDGAKIFPGGLSSDDDDTTNINISNSYRRPRSKQSLNRTDLRSLASTSAAEVDGLKKRILALQSKLEDEQVVTCIQYMYVGASKTWTEKILIQIAPRTWLAPAPFAGPLLSLPVQKHFCISDHIEIYCL